MSYCVWTKDDDNQYMADCNGRYTPITMYTDDYKYCPWCMKHIDYVHPETSSKKQEPEFEGCVINLQVFLERLDGISTPLNQLQQSLFIPVNELNMIHFSNMQAMYKTGGDIDTVDKLALAIKINPQFSNPTEGEKND